MVNLPQTQPSQHTTTKPSQLYREPTWIGTPNRSAPLETQTKSTHLGVEGSDGMLVSRLLDLQRWLEERKEARRIQEIITHTSPLLR
jgi:hypothetical protein